MPSNSWLGLTIRDTTHLGLEQTFEEPVDVEIRQQEDLKVGSSRRRHRMTMRLKRNKKEKGQEDTSKAPSKNQL